MVLAPDGCGQGRLLTREGQRYLKGAASDRGKDGADPVRRTMVLAQDGCRQGRLLTRGDNGTLKGQHQIVERMELIL